MRRSSREQAAILLASHAQQQASTFGTLTGDPFDPAAWMGELI
jgi:hypothetical protein